MLHVTVPGGEDLRLEHLVLDVNGTLTDRGELIDGVEALITELRDQLDLHVLSADSYGSAEDVAATLSAAYLRVHSAAEKVAYVMWLGAESCVAVGNGRNDAPMLTTAGLGIAVIGPESAWAGTLQAADIVTRSVHEALRLLNEPTALTAVLRP